MIALREALPAADVAALVAGAPQLLLRSEGELRLAAAELKRALQLDDAQASWCAGDGGRGWGGMGWGGMGRDGVAWGGA